MRLKNRRYAGGGAFSVPLGTPGPKLAPVVSNYRFSQPFIPTGPKADRSKYEFDMSALEKVKGHTNAVNWFTNRINALQSELQGLSDVDLLTNSTKARKIIAEYNRLASPATINAIREDYDRTQHGKEVVEERMAQSALATTGSGGMYVLKEKDGKLVPTVVSVSQYANDPGSYRTMTTGELLSYKDRNPDMVLSSEPHSVFESTYGINYITKYLQDKLKNLGHRKSESVKEGLGTLRDQISGQDIPALAKHSSSWKSNRQNLAALEETWSTLEPAMQAQFKAAAARRFAAPGGEWSEREITDMARLLMVRSIFDPAIVEESSTGREWGSAPSSGGGGGGGSSAIENMDPLNLAGLQGSYADFSGFASPDPSNPVNYRLRTVAFDISGMPSNVMLNDDKMKDKLGGKKVHALDGTELDVGRAMNLHKGQLVIIPVKPDGSPAPKEAIETHQELVKDYVQQKIPKGARVTPEQREQVMQEAFAHAGSAMKDQYRFAPKILLETKYMLREDDPARGLVDKQMARELSDSSWENDKKFTEAAAASGEDVNQAFLLGEEYDVISTYVLADPPTSAQARHAWNEKLGTDRRSITMPVITKSTFGQPLTDNTNFTTGSALSYGY